MVHRIESLVWNGGEARVRVRETSTKRWKDADADAAPETVEGICEDAWVKTPKGWRIKRTKTLQAEIKNPRHRASQ